jgi:hypothetical protein
MALELVQLCWLCGTRVSLEDCRIDEHGEQCRKNATSRNWYFLGAVLSL